MLGRSLAGSKPFQTEADCEDFLQRVAALCTEGALADERILGGGAFVERLLADVAERTKQTLRCSG